ncbi:MAG: hypothetical protein ACTSXT_13745 [Candidatus Helarchaeota archaeon]
MNIQVRKIIEENLISELQSLVTQIVLPLEAAISIGKLIDEIQAYYQGVKPIVENQKLIYTSKNKSEEFNTIYTNFLNSTNSFNGDVITVHSINGYASKKIFNGIINFEVS